MKLPLEGGCHCSALRYRITVAPIDSAYCHCRICQRTTGAPTVPWASVTVEGFAMTRGRPAVYKSSSRGERHFCGRCGCQIVYRDSERPKAVDVNLVTLDDTRAVTPEYHIFAASRIDWFEVADELPRYEDAGPDGE